MGEELAGIVEGTPERFVPELMHGELVEAEHLARYWWASALVEGKVALDAGCGVGYGSNILAQSGAREVIAIDVVPVALEAARRDAHSRVRVLEGDVRDVPLDDGSCDVVTCFEVIEHLEDTDAALDEFARVLTRAGVLAISSPNRNVSIPGNPHHKHEFVPDELAAALASRFRYVTLYPQHDWISSAVLAADEFATGDASTLLPTDVRKAVGRSPGSELHIVALASDQELPTLQSTTVLTETTEARRWLEEQAAALAHLNALQAELDDVKTERDTALEHLNKWKPELAWLRAVVDDTKAANRQLVDQQANLEAQVSSLNEALHALQQTRLWRAGSLYWRLRDRVRRHR